MRRGSLRADEAFYAEHMRKLGGWVKQQLSISRESGAQYGQGVPGGELQGNLREVAQVQRPAPNAAAAGEGAMVRPSPRGHDQRAKADVGGGDRVANPKGPPTAASSPPHALQLWCKVQRLPIPVHEFRFHPARGWRFDWAWPEHKVALEIEGGVWIGGAHARPGNIERDHEKYSEAAIMGWRILHVQPDELMSRGLDLIQRAFA